MKKKALITGGSRGIGASTVRAFCGAGYEVYFTFLESGDAAEALARETGAVAVKADVCSAEEMRRLYAVTGDVDALIANAGVSLVKLLTDTTEEEFDRVCDVNFKGVFLSAKQYLPGMTARGSGSIVNVSSEWGVIGGAMESVYSATKAAVIGLTKALAKEVGRSGVRVNCICPGAVDTDMLGSYSSVEREMIANDSPFGKIASPQEAAKAALLLCESGAAITGQVLGVNFC